MSRTTTSRQMVTAKNYDDLCVRAVEKIIDISARAVKDQGRCRIALTGGATPKGVYTLLASPPYRDRLDWSKFHFFLIDERFVPLQDPRSNYGMIVASGFPADHLHPIQTNVSDAATAAARYERELLDEFQLKDINGLSFDLVLLGLGEDGHIASLFPGHAALKEKSRLAVAVQYDGVPEPRVTITLPVINQAQTVLFLVSGKNKAEILKNVWEGGKKDSFPAGQVLGPKVWWLVDQAAASLLGGGI